MPFIGKPHQKSPVEQQAEAKSAHVAEVYVNRRKIAEHRGASEEEALSAARQEKAKYPGAKIEIRMRDAPRSK
jgi:hypothetical protein